jgi:hypothetical protein
MFFPSLIIHWTMASVQRLFHGMVLPKLKNMPRPETQQDHCTLHKQWNTGAKKNQADAAFVRQSSGAQEGGSPN